MLAEGFFKWGLLPITQTQCQRLLDACAMWPRMTGSKMTTDWAFISLYRWRCAFRLLLWFRIEEQHSVKQDTALASKKPFLIMAASGTLFSGCHEKTKTPLWLSSTPSWFSDPLLKWWEGSAARSVVGCFLLISFDHRANHSQFI